jgi:hypothetical protein
MPFLGHTENNKPCAEEVLFVRARLHKHTGTRRLREGKISLGIVTLYCALNSAMQWYVACPEHARKLLVKSNDNLNDDNILFDILRRSGVITSGFDYSAFSELVDEALFKNVSEFNYSGILTDIESVMTQLGILPFDESELPLDDPGISEGF